MSPNDTPTGDGGIDDQKRADTRERVADRNAGPASHTSSEQMPDRTTNAGPERPQVIEAIRTALNGTAAALRRLRRPDADEPTPSGQPEEVLGTDRAAWPTVAVVVLTWENYGEACDCLDSLAGVSYPNYRVVVVDNGSTDGSADALADEYDWCEFVSNDENIGFARGNNEGIRYALETGADYILLLNDDTVVPPDFLTPLVETMVRTDRAAAVGGLNYHADTGAVHNAGYEFFPSLGGQAVRYVRPRAGRPYDVGFIQSCLILLDPDFLREIGLLSDRYFLGLDDVELGWKANRRGRRVLTDPAAAIYHRVGKTSERGPFNVYHRTRNRLTFAADNLSASRTVAFALAFIAWMTVACLGWLRAGDTAKLRALLWGVSDFRRGADFRPYEAFD